MYYCFLAKYDIWGSWKVARGWCMQQSETTGVWRIQSAGLFSESSQEEFNRSQKRIKRPPEHCLIHLPNGLGELCVGSLLYFHWDLRRLATFPPVKGSFILIPSSRTNSFTGTLHWVFAIWTVGIFGLLWVFWPNVCLYWSVPPFFTFTIWTSSFSIMSVVDDTATLSWEKKWHFGQQRLGFGL